MAKGKAARQPRSVSVRLKSAHPTMEAGLKDEWTEGVWWRWFNLKGKLCLRRRVIETFKRQFPSLSTDTLNGRKRHGQS